MVVALHPEAKESTSQEAAQEDGEVDVAASEHASLEGLHLVESSLIYFSIVPLWKGRRRVRHFVGVRDLGVFVATDESQSFT